jgi:hypothetical protein
MRRLLILSLTLIHSYTHTLYIHTLIHTYTHTHIHSYTHTLIHTYTHQSPEIELYLDGKRPSLVSPGGKVITKVWTDGQQGEYNDYFADHCDGVTARIGHTTATARSAFLTGMTTAEKNLLKKCLGKCLLMIFSYVLSIFLSFYMSYHSLYILLSSYLSLS